VSNALRFLATRTVVNAARRLARRLRQPRYFITALAGLAWLAFLGRAGVPRAQAADPAAALPAAALGAMVFVVWGWLFGTGARALAFSPAEVTWLLPAPLPRTGLVNLKLLRMQGLVLLNSVLWVRRNKDTLAMGNMTGAMVFQSSFPVTVGLLLTPWELAHEALVAAVVALLAGSVLYLTLRVRGRLSARLLLLQGVFYVAYVAYVATKL